MTTERREHIPGDPPPELKPAGVWSWLMRLWRGLRDLERRVKTLEDAS